MMSRQSIEEGVWCEDESDADTGDLFGESAVSPGNHSDQIYNPVTGEIGGTPEALDALRTAAASFAPESPERAGEPESDTIPSTRPDTADLFGDSDPFSVLTLSGSSFYEVDPDTGECLGMHGAPEGTDEALTICAFISPRRRRLTAELGALIAARDAELKAISAYYAPLIREKDGALAWLEAQYLKPLEAYLRGVLMEMKAKKPNAKLPKSTRIGGLLLGFRQAGGGIEVLDEPTAIQYAKLTCPEAVKESILVSKFPKDGEFPEDSSGIRRVPVEDRFYVQ